MHTPIRTKQSARRATIAAQAAAMVVLACGTAMAFLGVPGLSVAEQPPRAEDPPAGGTDLPDGGAEAGTPYAAAVDPVTVDELLGMIGNAPVPAPEPEGGETVVETEEPDAGPGIRFVGTIKVGGRAAAFMNIGGVTKLLRPDGPEYQGVRLVSIVGDEVVISVDDGPAQTIERSAREGSAVSMVSGGAPVGVKTAESQVSGDPPPAADFTQNLRAEDGGAALLEQARSERGRWERDRGEGGGPPN